MAADLGIGLPIEHTIRTCMLALELGRRAGISEAERSDLYYLTLLRMLGCTAGSRESAEHFTDEIAFGRDTQHLDYGDPEGFGRWVMESFRSREAAGAARVVVEGHFVGTNTGSLPMPTGELPATGRRLNLPYCDVFEIEAGRIVAHRLYEDQMEFTAQLGLLPDPASAQA